MPIVENHTALNDLTASIDRQKNFRETIKQTFWQTSMGDK